LCNTNTGYDALFFIVAIFAVPGAFTPGCSKSHLPSFMTAQDELKAKGVELTICIATNDAYVMEVSV